MHEAAGFAQAPQEVEVLEQREGTKTADGIIDGAADKNTGVAVTESYHSQKWIDGSELPGRTRGSIK